MTMCRPSCERVFLQQDRGKERTIICSWVLVLMCVYLLPGLLHEPQDFRLERVNEFYPRDLTKVLKQALEHLHIDKCEMF